MSKTKLSCREQSDRVQFVIKTRLNNDVTDSIGLVYAENKTELSWLIGPIQYVTKIRQNNDVIDHIGVLYAETKLSYHDQLDWVQSTQKTK